MAQADLSAESFSVPSSRYASTLRTCFNVLVGVAIFAAIWGIFAAIFNSSGASALEFPTPVDAVARLGDYLFCGKSLYGHSLIEHIGASVSRLLVAFSLAMVVGITLGSIIGYFPKAYAIGMVPVAIFQMIPGLAWLPVAILLFGLGDASAVFIIFAVSSMVITVGVAGGIRMVPPVLIRAARMMGAGNLRIFFTVLVPQASSAIVSALRVGMSSAWRVLIAAEMVVGTGLGVGYSIELTRDLLDYVGSFACIMAICLLGLALDRLVLANIEKLVRRRLGIVED